MRALGLAGAPLALVHAASAADADAAVQAVQRAMQVTDDTAAAGPAPPLVLDRIA